MESLAKSLVETLNFYHRRERPAPSDIEEVRVLLDQLEGEGLITTRASFSQGKYVVLDSVHHGPVMLGLHSEVYFCSLEFARLCRDAYKKLLHTSAPSILQVIEYGEM